MFRLIFAVSLQVSSLFSILAQTGDYPVQDHATTIPGIDNSSFDIAFDQQGLMYVANRSGLLRYDGKSWEYIATPSSVFSLAVDEADRIYIGCMGSFGFLELSESGLEYRKLSPDSISDQFFFSTQVIGDSVLFLSRDSLWSYSPSQNLLHTYSAPDKFEMVSLTHDNQSIFLNTEIASYQWDDSGFKESDYWIGADYPPLHLEIGPGRSAFLSLDLTGKLFYRSDSSALRQILSKTSPINFVKWINDSLFVASTRNRGVFIVDSRHDFEVVGRVNYENGLPDNEVVSLEVDWSQGIWVAHQFGFSRIDPIAPVHCLSNQEGLEGNLTQSKKFRQEIIVGTSSGAFRLVQDSVFSITTAPEKINESDQSSNSTSQNNQLFKKLFSGSKANKGSTRSPKKEERVLEYVRWKYQRLEGVISKCNSLVVFGDILLIGTNSGLFEYNGERTIKILNQTVKKIVPIPKTNEFLVLNNDFGVERFMLEGGQYNNLTFGYNQGLVLDAFGDSRGLIWLVTPGKILSAGMTYYGASVLDEIPFKNQYFEKPTFVELKDRLYFITSEGYFAYDYQQKTLQKDTILEREVGHPVHHFNDESGSFWIFDGKLWKHIDQHGKVTTFSYLSLYPDISFINKSKEEGSIYFINKRDELYKYLPNEDNEEIYQSHLFYKHLFAKSAYSSYVQVVNLNYDENYLRAEITQPDYVGLLKVEFQYKVEGLDYGWSEWSVDNKIMLNFIPDGAYELRVRSRDVFGRIQEVEPIQLVISPPYWRTTWFYMLEVIFFAGLVIVSARLNQGKVGNRFITEGLTILTIVMIIEFLQSAAQSFFDIASSPIFDFLINLSVALIIFPLELLLKRIIRGRKQENKLVFAGKKSSKSAKDEKG